KQIANTVCLLSSHKVLAQKTLAKYHNLFLTQDYPKSSIIPNFNNYLSKYFNHPLTVTSSPSVNPPVTKTTFVRVPTFSNPVMNLSPKWRDIASTLNLNITCVPYLQPNILTKFSKGTNINNNHNTVYAIVCNECNSPGDNVQYPIYIGHTSRRVEERLRSHLSESASPVGLHVKNTSHKNPVIIPLIKVPDVNLRVFYESVLISIFKPRLNGYDAAPILLHSSNLTSSMLSDIKCHFLKIIKVYYDAHVLIPVSNSVCVLSSTSNVVINNNNIASVNVNVPPTLRRSRRLLEKSRNQKSP
ncbi:MAG TPA: hypothetical protein VKR58_15300, partial [Aquella sp.]|nr:hypothetical protein [Aquella sp.]